MRENSKTISCLAGHRVKQFEKEIRRYLKKIPDPVIDTGAEFISTSTLHVYIFKNILDTMYLDLEEDEFPFMHILIYSYIFTLRNLKTDTYIASCEDEYEDLMKMVNNHDVVTLYIYDDKFLHKPENPFCEIFCAVNKKRSAVIPMSFSKNLGLTYPEWFKDELEYKQKVEVGIDFDLIERVKMVMS